MLKYKQNRKLISLVCDHCSQEYEKPITEYNRNLKIGRKMFCSRLCAGKSVSNISKLNNIRSKYDISSHSNNKIDEFSKFRYYYRNIKSRTKEVDLTLQDLKDQWELQSGICPYTKLKLLLYDNNTKHPYCLRASIDRIDNKKGYLKGNIEFVSLPINYLKSDQLSKEETLQFLLNVTSNFH